MPAHRDGVAGTGAGVRNPSHFRKCTASTRRMMLPGHKSGRQAVGGSDTTRRLGLRRPLAIRTPISWLGARDIGGLLFGRSFFLGLNHARLPGASTGFTRSCSAGGLLLAVLLEE